MESFACGRRGKNGIKPMKLLGIVPMNKAQNLLLATGLTISSVFAMNAQSNDNDAKLLADASVTNTEMVAKKSDVLTPAIRKGHAGDASFHSGKHDLLVVYIYGAKGRDGKKEPYTAEQYARILQKAFGDEEYTNYPTDIVVFYEESGLEGSTIASVYINGREYKTKDGTRTFTPIAVGNNIDVFTKKYADEKKKLAGLQNSSTNTNTVAVNKPDYD